MDTLSESYMLVGFGVFRKRSVFFIFFIFFNFQVMQSSSYFLGCEVHSVRDAAYLAPPSISFIDCIHNTCCLVWGGLRISPSSMFSLHLSSLQNDDLYDFDILSSMIRHTEPSQSGLCAPCVGLFVFLFVLFHKGHELVWSPVMAERPLCHGWRATDLKPCFLSCSWVELGVQYNFLLPACWRAGRHRINSDKKCYSMTTKLFLMMPNLSLLYWEQFISVCVFSACPGYVALCKRK